MPEIINNNMTTEEFDGVFRFTNNSDEEFKVLWNNKEYTFAPKSRSPILISNESAENIQAIRKKWAYKWAEREWFKTEQYKKLNSMGNGLPPVRQEADLEPLIQMCLEPLPITMAKIEDKPRKEVKGKATRPMTSGQSKQAMAESFSDMEIEEVGQMPDSFEA